MKNYKAVIFDMDGVIFDSERKVVECWQVVAEKYDVKNIEEACQACLGLTREAVAKVMLERYGAEFPYEEYKDEMSALFHKRYGEGRLPMKPGIVEILTWLKENGFKTAVASSTRREVVEQEIRDAGLLRYFDALICGDMVSHSKPHPEIFCKACEVLKVSPEDAFGIEDSYNGIRASKKAGLHTIMVPDMMPPNDEMKELTDIICKDLFEAKNYILEFLS